MKPVTNNVALVLSLFICLSSLSSNHALDTKTISEICADVTYKDTCKESFKNENITEDLKHKSDRVVAAVKIASNNGTEIAILIEKTLDESKDMKPDRKTAFEACEANFDTALKKLEDTLESMENEDYEKMKEDVSSAIDDANDCDKGQHGDKELSEKTKMFCKLCVNAIDITSKYLN